MIKGALPIVVFVTLLTACSDKKTEEKEHQATVETTDTFNIYTDTYVPFKLTTDLSVLEAYEVQMIPHLIKAAEVMNELFWQQAYHGNKEELLNNIIREEVRGYARMNYGPWDRLNENKPFVDGAGPKPAGANFYPTDITKEEMRKSGLDTTDQYSVIRRNANGNLESIPYHVHYKEHLQKAAGHIRDAAKICESEELKNYLTLRADALLTDNFDPSDIAWLGMKENGIDLIIGPIEHYEDGLYGAKTGYEAYVLVKDKSWSEKLEKYVAWLPELQKNLPVDEAYKKEKPGSSSQLNAYDVVYYAGHCNAGAKTIAVNLPNDEEIQINHGTRRSQLKNAMKAKFDHILLPISDELIHESQRQYITFDAFFANTMFHEVAHGLGIKNTIDGNGAVKDALGELHSGLEEGKADILGLYMVTYLREKGAIDDGQLMDNYVTFMASIFRSIRFGGSSAHGEANMIRFNYFLEKGAFSRDSASGTYLIHLDKMKEAVNSLSAMILMLQGNGDKPGVEKLVAEMGKVGSQLKDDLARLTKLGIPVDIVFEQGTDVLGIKSN